jgi:hypothetical protein
MPPETPAAADGTSTTSEVADVGADLARRVGAALAALLDGLYNIWSEGDALWEAFGAAHPDGPVTAGSFATAAGLPAGTSLEVLDIQRYLDWARNPEAGQAPEAVAAWEAFAWALRALVPGPAAYVAGRGQGVQVTLVLGGLLAGGGIAGVRTLSIET